MFGEVNVISCVRRRKGGGEEEEEEGKGGPKSKHSVFLSYKEFKWNARGPGGLRDIVCIIIIIIVISFFFIKKIFFCIKI